MQVTAMIEKAPGKTVSEDGALIGGQVVRDDGVTEFSGDLPGQVYVADGVGGNLGGREASDFVLAYVRDHFPAVPTEDTIRGMLLAANAALLERAAAVRGQEAMATTLTGVYLDAAGGLVAHSGNTRLYALHGAYLKQVTRDQTRYQFLLDAGDPAAAAACNPNELVGCMGGGEPRYGAGVTAGKLGGALPAALLLLSDGIHGFVDLDTLETLLQSGRPDREIVGEYLRLARQAGSDDDLTAVIVRI